MDKNLEISLLFDFYGQLLSDKQRQAVSLYYNDDLSLSEVAMLCGITRQGARDLVRRSEAELYEYEKKLGLFARFEQVGETASQIRSLAESVLRSGDSSVQGAAEDIITLADKLYEQEA
ncbi:MAG: YlxM family DNA-binding protein [Ruminococcus sp.]|nr:YlxM family DNA-binding protein [Ruminococcus sp.]